MRSDLVFDTESASVILGKKTPFFMIPIIPEDSDEVSRLAAVIYAMYFGVLQRYVSPLCFVWSGKKITGIDESYEPGVTPDYPEGYFEAYIHNAQVIWEYIERGWIPAEMEKWREEAQRLLATDLGREFIYHPFDKS